MESTCNIAGFDRASEIKSSKVLQCADYYLESWEDENNRGFSAGQ